MTHFNVSFVVVSLDFWLICIST